VGTALSQTRKVKRENCQEQAKMAATQLYIMADEERHSAGLAHVIRLSEGKLQTGDALQIEPLTWPVTSTDR
jgi:hypothetical protein